jgi:aspartate 1-decarboxylase
MVAEEKVHDHKPKVAIMNEKNQIVELLGQEPAATIL